MDQQPPTTSTTTVLPLQDRVAIVTGASRGIGRAIALHLGSLGARLVINYTSTLSHPQAHSLVTQLNSSSSLPPPRAVSVQADVSDEAQVASLFATAEHAFNAKPHIVVTSAGVIDPTYSTLAEISAAEFDRIFAVNTRGTFLCMKEAANRVVHGGGGRIVTVSSSVVASLKARCGAYAASKAAVDTMTKIMAKELKGSRITVNSVAPGPVATEMFFEGRTEEMVKKAIEESPLGRLGEVEDVAPVVGFLVADSGEWVNGQVIRVNGGYV